MLNNFKIASFSIINFYRNLKWRNIPLGYLWLFLILLFFIKQLIWPHHILDSQEYLDVSKKWGNTEFFQNQPLAQNEPIVQNQNSALNQTSSLNQLYQNHRRTPLYSLLIFIGGQSYFLPLLLQCFAIIYLPYGVWQLNQYCFKSQFELSNSSQRFAFLFWGFLVSWPLINYYSVIAIPELLTSALIVLLINNIHRNWIVSVVITALVAFKPVFIVFIPVLLVHLFKPTSFWVWLLPATFLLLWSYEGKKQLGFYSISSITITNPYDYNRKLLLSKELNDSQIDQLYQNEVLEFQKLKSSKDVAELMSQKVKKSILQEPIYYSYIHLKGVLATLIDPGRYDAMVFWNWHKSSGFMGVNDGHSNSSKRRIGEWLYVGFFLTINTLKLFLIIIGAIHLHGKIKPSFYWLLIALVMVYLLSIGPVGSARYLIPLYGILAFFGGWGIVVLCDKFCKTRTNNQNENTFTK